MEKNAAPPPYSETDVLSNPDSRPQFTPTTSHADNLSTVSSTSGTATPIFTPASSVHPHEVTEKAAPSPADADHQAASSFQGNSNGANTATRTGGFLQANNDGFRLGPIVANNQGFRIGSLFVADGSGVRIGGERGFVASGAGVSIGGQAIGSQRAQAESSSRGRQAQSGSNPGHEKGRAHSTSSSSSSSSSESSRSDASIGSLPDYDDLKTQQLPVARQSLLEWLDHPEQPVTRENVQDVRQQLKIAGKAGDVTQGNDSREMRAEVKDLMKRFKELRKVQRKQRKIQRKERKTLRKAARKERKRERKEAKRARKSQRRGHGAQNSTMSTNTPLPYSNSRSLSGASQDAERLRNEANRLDTMAAAKEHSAASLRNVAANLATSDDKARAINLRKATEQEEEGVQFRLEAVRLRSEALQLDGEDVEHAPQVTGVVKN